MQYQFAAAGLRMPDPTSRQQAHDVHGPSVIVDPRAHRWTDADWRGRPWHEAVIYELHVGTFTPQGTFAAIVDQLDYLRSLGITALELMPVADFPGKRGWGYDGVLLFAPDTAYGSADDLKVLVQEAHRRGLMVLLDVVYNHFGPEGNYLHVYAKHFFNEKHHTPWGAGLNFDSRDNELVRQFFISNALYWLREFNFDGLRFDAVHAIQDDSQRRFLDELVQTIRANVQPDRHVHLVLENDNNNAGMLATSAGDHAAKYTAQWNDDFHHCLHVLSTGEKTGYYADYAEHTSHAAPAAHLLRVLTEGFAYQGDPSPYRQRRARGEQSRHLPATAFVSFLQNHDQVGNRAFGERLSMLAPPEAVSASLALLLLCPQIPLIFMGEEWAASTPFYFFCDLGPDLAPAVTKGRREEFAGFEQFQDPAVRDKIPDPCAEQTFKQSILNWHELAEDRHADVKDLVQELLSLRQSQIVPLLPRLIAGGASGQLLAPNALQVSWAIEQDSATSTKEVLAASSQSKPRVLTLLANLSASPANIELSPDTEFGTLLFSTVEDDQFAVVHGASAGRTKRLSLPPWLVSWFLR
jgi:1,4-alpha-glucan branching enzyme/maltooligosyltrehalose trehalohydrolase